MSSPTQFGRTVADAIDLLAQAERAALCVRVAVRPRGFEQHDYLVMPPALLEDCLRALPLERAMPCELISRVLYVGSLGACQAISSARSA